MILGLVVVLTGSPTSHMIVISHQQPLFHSDCNHTTSDRHLQRPMMANAISPAHSTDLSLQNNNTNASPTCPFLRLPTELRLHIYDLLFASLAKPDLTGSTGLQLLNIPAVLYTSPQLFQEAVPAFLYHYSALEYMLSYRFGFWPARERWQLARTRERLQARLCWV